MTDLEKAARQALDALLRAGLGGTIQMNQRAIDSAVGILRSALEQAEPVQAEPVRVRWDRPCYKCKSYYCDRPCKQAEPVVGYPTHITDGTGCWCDPDLDYVDPETGAKVWVHKGAQ